MSNSSARLLAAALLVTTLAAAAAPASAQGIAFEELGRAFLKLHCGRKAQAGSCALEEVVAREYVRVRLGAFEVALPAASLTDRKLAEDFRSIAIGLLDLQGRFARWQELPTEVLASLDEDLGQLRDWAGTWTTPSLARMGRADEKELLSALGAPEVVRSAAERLRATTSGEGAKVLAPQWVGGVSLVLCPKRRDFMELIGFLGLDDLEWRNQHWMEGADQWTQVWKGTLLVLALEYAPWTGTDPGFHTSMPADRFDKEGVLQHALNQAARALLFRVINRGDMDHFARALAANLVIETVGRIAVLDGEGQIRTTGARTEPYERFVPGGLSEGGVLPAIPASPLDSFAVCRWREGKGTDWFVAALRSGQKDGAKAAARDRDNRQRKDKRAHFQLDGDDGEATWTVSAPFLSSLASQQPYPPPTYLNDYREFFKSYQAAFWRWVRTQAVDGDAAASARRLEDLLRALGRAGEDGQALDEPLEAVVQRLYGVPLSGSDGSVDSLEWRFLDWLSKQG